MKKGLRLSFTLKRRFLDDATYQETLKATSEIPIWKMYDKKIQGHVQK